MSPPAVRQVSENQAGAPPTGQVFPRQAPRRQVGVYLNLVVPGAEILGPRPFLVTVRDSHGRTSSGIGTPRLLFLSRLREGFFNDVFGDGEGSRGPGGGCVADLNESPCGADDEVVYEASVRVEGLRADPAHALDHVG